MILSLILIVPALLVASSDISFVCTNLVESNHMFHVELTDCPGNWDSPNCLRIPHPPIRWFQQETLTNTTNLTCLVYPSSFNAWMFVQHCNVTICNHFRIYIEYHQYHYEILTNNSTNWNLLSIKDTSYANEHDLIWLASDENRILWLGLIKEPADVDGGDEANEIIYRLKNPFPNFEQIRVGWTSQPHFAIILVCILPTDIFVLSYNITPGAEPPLLLNQSVSSLLNVSEAPELFLSQPCERRYWCLLVRSNHSTCKIEIRSNQTSFFMYDDHISYSNIYFEHPIEFYQKEYLQRACPTCSCSFFDVLPSSFQPISDWFGQIERNLLSPVTFKLYEVGLFFVILVLCNFIKKRKQNQSSVINV